MTEDKRSEAGQNSEHSQPHWGLPEPSAALEDVGCLVPKARPVTPESSLFRSHEGCVMLGTPCLRAQRPKRMEGASGARMRAPLWSSLPGPQHFPWVVKKTQQEQGGGDR